MRYSTRGPQSALFLFVVGQLSFLGLVSFLALADANPALGQAEPVPRLSLQADGDEDERSQPKARDADEDDANDDQDAGPSFSVPAERDSSANSGRTREPSDSPRSGEQGNERASKLRQPGSPPGARSSQPPSARRVRPGAEPEGQSSDAAQEAPGTSSASSAGKSRIMEAYRKSKTANSADAFTEIIDLCREGMQDSQGMKKDTITYARTLMAWAYNRRGEARAKAGEDNPALEDFQAAVDLDSTLWRAIHNRGVSYATMGKYKEAVDDFDETIRLRPNYPNAYFNRGELHYEQADYESAIKDYNHAIRLAPEDAAAYNSRGHSYYRLNQFRRALEDYNAAVRLEPQKAAAYINRGDAYADLGLYAQADRDYRNAVRLDPKTGRALQSGAWLMATCPDQRYRNPELAVEWAQQAIELDGDSDYRYLETLAAAWANAGKFDQARRAQAEAIRAAPPEHVDRNRQRMELYERRSPYREAARQPTPPVENQRTRRSRF